MEIKREAEQSGFEILGLNELLRKLADLETQLTGTIDKEKQKETLAQMRELFEIAGQKASVGEAKQILNHFAETLATYEDVTREEK